MRSARFAFILLLLLATPVKSARGTPPPSPKTPCEGVRLNEILTYPEWDGTGCPDQWIEIHNAGPDACDFDGWKLKHVKSITTQWYTITSQSLPANGFLVLHRSETGIALDPQGGCSLWLIPPPGTPEVLQYWGTPDDMVNASWALNDAGSWDLTTCPTPGQANRFCSRNLTLIYLPLVCKQ